MLLSLPMGTMNISLPDSLKEYVDEQVGECGYGTSSEYVRELIRKDQDRKRLRAMILEGATSGLSTPVDENYFEALRMRVRSKRK
jgi:antitoxin ParD1/3/4